ncbi:hypothetical protein OQA88_8298 [Cercophora sp. LCS_1]
MLLTRLRQYSENVVPIRNIIAINRWSRDHRQPSDFDEITASVRTVLGKSTTPGPHIPYLMRIRSVDDARSKVGVNELVIDTSMNLEALTWIKRAGIVPAAILKTVMH